MRKIDVDRALHTVALRRRAQTAANRRREAAVQATGEATRKRNAEAGSALTADDFAALPPAQRVSAVAQGYTAHLDSVPQLSRAEITELEPAEINQSRRLGMLDAVLAGKPAV